MEYLVKADVELDGKAIKNCPGITLKQKFNEHHEFTIRLDYDLVESTGVALSLTTAQKYIGKTALIRLNQVVDNKSTTAYEFRGIICEVRMEQSSGLNADIILSGYSPTILLENGQSMVSYSKLTLKDLVNKLTEPVAANGCSININSSYSKQFEYICQYKESAFHFLNRLSAEFGDCFYYDGKALNFGKPPSVLDFEIVSGEDVTSMQLALRALPAKFSNYGYNAEKDQFFESEAPNNVEGAGQYGSQVLKESQNLFSESVITNARSGLESKGDLNDVTRTKKTAIAANMEVLTATSIYPSICIGSVINLKISVFKDKTYTQEDYGEFLITGIEHFISDNGKYYNSFEAIPSGLKVIPVNNIIMPIAETQVATVVDNDDEKKMGRVKVQMLWQKSSSEQTDWIRVMTPDAGEGDDGKNRGLLCIPEINDQVMVGFRYNDPDRPFVLGSMYTGKTGEGGKDKNETKSYTTKSGSTIKFEKDKISIIDAKKKSKILFDGEGKMKIESQDEIKLECGQSTITMKKDGTIEIKGKEITIDASSKATIKAMSGIDIKASGGDVKIEGINAEMSGQVGAKVKGNATAEISSGAQTTVKGAMVMIN
jgi:type VI secretion system secreted protein VgrG